MAITISTETIAVTTEERTWRVNIETPRGEVPTVTVFREVVRTDAPGAVISRVQGATISRQADAVAEQSFTAAGITVTGAQLASLVAQAADQWRQEDIAAAARTVAS
jgi:hypothetical protein